MAVIDAEVICLDSDEDENPEPSSSKLNGRGVTMELIEGEDISHLIVPKINYRMGNGTFGANETQSSTKRPRIRTIDAASPGQTPRIKHYGNVSQIIQTVPLSAPSHTFSKVNSILSRETRPRIPIINLDFPTRVSNNIVHVSRTPVVTFDADSPTTVSTRSRRPSNLHFVFRCTYGHCGRIIRGDVNFVFHLWAHVAGSMERVEVFNEKGVKLGTRKKLLPKLNAPFLECVSRCPECLAIFPTPGILLIHYTKCHSKVKQVSSNRGTCHICERDMTTPAGLQEHMVVHDPADAPYVCKMCNFRSNVRSHVISHYSQKHRHTGLLMCPFCFFHILVEPPARMSDPWNIDGSAVKREAKKFVEHMWNHTHIVKTHCDMCAICLGKDRASIEEHMAQHEFDCSQRGYAITPTAAKKPIVKSHVIVEPTQCKQCGKRKRSTIRPKLACTDCRLKKFLKKAEEKQLIIPGEDAVYKCKTCRLVTDDVRRLFEHVNYSGHEYQRVDPSGNNGGNTEKMEVVEESNDANREELNKAAKLARSVKKKRAFIRATRAAQRLENYRNLDIVEDFEDFRAGETEDEDPMEYMNLYNSISEGYTSLPEIPPMSEVVMGGKTASSNASKPVESTVVEIFISDDEEEQKTKEKQRKPISIMKPIKKEMVETIENEEGLEEAADGDKKESEERSWRKDSDEDDEKEEEQVEGENYVNFAYDEAGYDVDPTSLFEENDQEQSPSTQKRPSEDFEETTPRKKHHSGATKEEFNEENCDKQEEMEEVDDSRATTPVDELMEVTDADDDIQILN